MKSSARNHKNEPLLTEFSQMLAARHQLPKPPLLLVCEAMICLVGRVGPGSPEHVSNNLSSISALHQTRRLSQFTARRL